MTPEPDPAVRAAMSDYTGDDCPFCARNRVELGPSGYRCEKCEQVWGANIHAKLMQCAEWNREAARAEGRLEGLREAAEKRSARYCFWAYNPTGEVCMVDRSLHHFVCRRIDASDEAHYGDGTWCYIGLSSGQRGIARVLNSEDDVLAAEAAIRALATNL